MWRNLPVLQLTLKKKKEKSCHSDALHRSYHRSHNSIPPGAFKAWSSLLSSLWLSYNEVTSRSHILSLEVKPRFFLLWEGDILLVSFKKNTLFLWNINLILQRAETYDDNRMYSIGIIHLYWDLHCSRLVFNNLVLRLLSDSPAVWTRLHTQCRQNLYPLPWSKTPALFFLAKVQTEVTALSFYYPKMNINADDRGAMWQSRPDGMDLFQKQCQIILFTWSLRLKAWQSGWTNSVKNMSGFHGDPALTGGTPDCIYLLSTLLLQNQHLLKFLPELQNKNK